MIWWGKVDNLTWHSSFFVWQKIVETRNLKNAKNSVFLLAKLQSNFFRASSMVGSPEPPADPNPSTSRNYVSKVEDLRVADIIISHKKKDSTDSTKTLIGRNDSGSSHLYSSKSSDYSGKLSAISSTDGNSVNGSNLSPNVSSFSSDNGASISPKMVCIKIIHACTNIPYSGAFDIGNSNLTKFFYFEHLYEEYTH